jgi:hypothetical protein
VSGYGDGMTKETIAKRDCTGWMQKCGLFLATCMLALMAGCGSVKPKNDQQAVFASAGTVASALIAANAYQSLPDCSVAPQPCSTADVNAKLQVAKLRLVDAYKRADALVNSPGYEAGELAKAQAILQAALDFLVSITPTP